MTSAELIAEAMRLSGLLDDALSYLRRQTVEYASSENAYRKAKAEAWLKCPSGTVPEREAAVNAAVADQRQVRDLADGMRQAALEAVRSRRAQISALQSMLNAQKAEADFARTGPA